MALSVTCPQCEQTFKVKDEFAGKKARCPSCQGVIVIPGGAPSAPAAASNPFAFDEAPQNAPKPKKKAPPPPDDDEVDEPAPKPKQKATRPAAEAGNPFAFEGEQEESPAPKSKRKAAPPPPEDDEEDEEPPPPPKKKAAKPAPPPPADDGNPFAFDPGAPAEDEEDEEAPRKKPKKKEAAPPVDSGNPFGFDEGPSREDLEEDDDDDDDDPRSRRSSSRRGRESDSQFGRTAARRGGRVGTWTEVASGCNSMMIAAIIFAASMLLFLIGSQSASSPDAVFTILLIAIVGTLVATIFSLIACGPAKRAPDPAASGLGGLSSLFSIITTVVVGILLCVVLYLRLGSIRSTDTLVTIFRIMQITMIGAFAAGPLTHVFFSRMLMRASLIHQHPGLGVWGLVNFIGFLAILGLGELTMILSLTNSSGRGGGLVGGSDVDMITTIAMLVFSGLYIVLMVIAKGVLTGRIKAPPPRSSRPRGRGRSRDDYDDEDDDREQGTGEADNPFGLGDEPDDRDDERPRRRGR